MSLGAYQNMVMMGGGFDVSMISIMLPDSIRVGSFTILFCNPNYYETLFSGT